ncbi:hypothetical protein [Pseudoalteromonas luteoviolacea]|uniref:Uncharacterized protein n=1 Tax=Pseudoalteromonas luteoviolacea NCIMB 1942 TaxID=1365253 RepID=A0A167GNI3_9GAMM|nr:hypothetical protein [Pseudoalteromonas luteoviolacea]KZN55851.1 hypothetical protein N482_05075 [Pseudoalteromonas luteoviolacea NCIMB 1942]KZX00282.1 hypothetical protein JL49_12200 [Pseudoalteromonas luteoviolacea]
MKRLFYCTDSLDDAEKISDEVHELGIDDHHFYVLSRDENGIKTHHLHGSTQIEKTQILSARKRALILAGGTALLILTFLYFFTEVMNKFLLQAIGASIVIGFIVMVVVRLAGKSFDEYFQILVNEHLDAGDVIIIIDVAKSQTHVVESKLEDHPKAQFLADSSNLASPIPE